jgi:hypothetical protein
MADPLSRPTVTIHQYHQDDYFAIGSDSILKVLEAQPACVLCEQAHANFLGRCFASHPSDALSLDLSYSLVLLRLPR